MTTSPPTVSVDKVAAYIPYQHRNLICGGWKEMPSGFCVPQPFWITLPSGTIGVHSDKHDRLVVQFNPGQIAYGHNILFCDDPLLLPFRRIAETLDRKLSSTLSPPEKAIRANVLRQRAGRIALRELHLCADFAFPSLQSLRGAYRELRDHWNSPRNRVQNKNFSGTIYLNQKRWDLVVYDKGTHVSDEKSEWPADIRALAQNRLRVEVRLRRQELRSLGARLARAVPGFPVLDLSIAYDWDALIYNAVYDLYVSRLRPKGNPTPAPGVVPLFRLFEQFGARPAYRRIDGGESWGSLLCR